MATCPDPIHIGETLEWHRPNGRVESGTVGIGRESRPVFISVDHSTPVYIGDANGEFLRPWGYQVGDIVTGSPL